METGLREAYKVLDDVLRRGAFVNIALKNVSADSKALVTRIVYGALERRVELDYIISSLTSRCKPALKTLLVEAAYIVKYMDNIPAYAATDTAVEYAGALFGAGVKGFVNAVLKNVAKGNYSLPASGEKAEEIKYNAPHFIIEALERDGFDPAAFLLPPRKEGVHFRISSKYTAEQISPLVPDMRPSPVGGYISKPSAALEGLNAEGKITFQSPSSMECVHALGDLEGKTLLDACAAPGGKAVYAAELGAAVTARDMHPHRTRLIRSYAERMGVKLKTETRDATIRYPEDDMKFDRVLLDVPCSGLGVLSSRPDVVLNKRAGDIEELTRVQYNILSVSSGYVKRGGILVYSTCTPLKAETERQIERFLQNNVDFRILDYKNNTEFGRIIMPDTLMDGFFVAAMERI